ncbi:MAG: LuxR family transcriptional regulator [Eggerthellaceae bacterium]|nr:LuxR family transcriptional regulator [Eggerthellaceae bacterium]
MSARRIIGFACNQAFIFFLLFMGAGHVAERFDLLFTMLFLVVGFAFVRAIGPSRAAFVFARPLLYIYAVVAAAGSLLGLFAPDGGLPIAAGQGLLVGVPSAFLLTAWGRAFGREATKVSVQEIFIGSLVGALVCLIFSFAIDSPVVSAAVRLLPLASVVNIEVGPDLAEKVSPPAEPQARVLSFKILAGTLLFGMAAGLMLLHRAEPGDFYQVSLILYGAFLIGGLSLLLSDGFGRGAALNKSYRLAVFVMMVGVLLVPWPLLAGSVLPGESVVLAGFFGLEVVLISLFVVIADITGTDCALSFSAGFASLYAGGLAGALIALTLERTGYAIVVLAGAIILLSYLFLFTERDFDELSQLVTESDTRDSLEAVCAEITETYGLSNRESEILAFALRGRTSERIAQELVISKSTVDTHLRRIYAKCGIHSRQELLDLAERR